MKALNGVHCQRNEWRRGQVLEGVILGTGRQNRD